MKKIKSILRQLNGEAGEAEKQAFTRWLLKKPEHLDLYIDIKNLWELPYPEVLRFDESKAQKQINHAMRKDKKETRLWQFAQQVAAVSIILLIIGTLSYHQLLKFRDETAPIKLVSKTSGAGEQVRFSLPDGSVVHLNAASTIQFPEKFDGTRRQVIFSGEAFFEVAKDPNRPFVIKSDRLTTTVLGTSFNIKAYNKGDITVTVATGKVKVVNDDESQSGEVFLHPNQQVIYNKQTKGISMNEVTARDYFQWTNGTIRFNDDPLAEVVRMLERWYNVRILLKNIKNENIKVNGGYHEKKLYAILDGLRFMYGLDYYYINDTTIIISQQQSKMH